MATLKCFLLLVPYLFTIGRMSWQSNKSKYLIPLFVFALLYGCRTEQIQSDTPQRQPVTETDQSTFRSSWKYQAASANVESWDALREEFQLPDFVSTPAVQTQINWYLNHPAYFNRICKRAAPYMYYIREELKKRNLPGELALLPMIESAYNPFVYSNKGAAGLWQMMPMTAANFGLKLNWWYDGRRDIYTSTKAALNYLAYLHKFFQGDWLLAIAAYDSGEGTILNAVRRNAGNGESTDFWSLHLSRETKTYVPRLLAVAALIKNYENYSVLLPTLKNKPYFKEVQLDSQIGLEQAASLAEITFDELFILNPGFNRWATDPDGPHRLLLPVQNVSTFEKKLAKIPKLDLVKWQHHIVKNGDTLHTVAAHYGSSENVIKRLNKLTSAALQIGRHLIIPITTRMLPKSLAFRSLYQIPSNFITKTKHFLKTRRIVHDVHHGETINSIARRYDVSPSEIRKWNGLGNRQNLSRGKKIVIWQNPNIYQPKVYSPLPTLQRIHVRQGDTLIKLAKRYHMTPRFIAQINHLKNDTVYPGQILKVEKINYPAQAKNSIAKKHKLNPHHPRKV